MLYKIKNLTGDTTNPNSALWEPVKLYATSDRYQAVLPIFPQQTAIVSEHAMVELTNAYPSFVQVLDVDGMEQAGVPYRINIPLDGTWQYIDLGRFAGQLGITNPSTTNLMQFSFSGFTAPATAPPTITISDVLPGETISIDQPMSPIRFVYVKGVAGSTGYVLSD